MHAVVITEPGGPEVLRWTEVPDPVPGPGEVLIDVAASAVNRADMMQRQGHYPPPKGAAPYPGLECSGTIAAVGADVTGWQAPWDDAPEYDLEAAWQLAVTYQAPTDGNLPAADAEVQR